MEKQGRCQPRPRLDHLFKSLLCNALQYERPSPLKAGRACRSAAFAGPDGRTFPGAGAAWLGGDGYRGGWLPLSCDPG